MISLRIVENQRKISFEFVYTTEIQTVNFTPPKIFKFIKN
jgi:hypothetical protein